jgi:type II secretory pathway component PulK
MSHTVRESRKGVALLSALGALALLGILSSVFSAHMRLENAFATRDGQELEAHYLASAGVQDAISRLRTDSPAVDAYAEAWWPGSSPEMTPLGNGGYTLNIEDESARLDILRASPEMLGVLLGSDNEALATIVGYRSTKTLFSIEDLEGADIPAYARSRMTTLATTLGDGKININTANADVLAALPGMDSIAAQLVVEFRRGPDGMEGTSDDFVFAVSEDIAKVPNLTAVRVAPAIPLIKVSTGLFRVVSVGTVYRGGRKVANEKIVAVLSRDPNREVNIVSWEGS